MTINQIAVVAANVVAVTPCPCQGETEANPSPAPRASRRSDTDAATKAPAIMAPHEAADRPCATWPAPRSSARVGRMDSIRFSLTMRTHRQEQNDRQRDAQHPKQNSTAHKVLL